MQLLHPLLGARDFNAAALGEHAHLLVLTHTLQCQLSDFLAVVRREDEVRGVAGRTSRVG